MRGSLETKSEAVIYRRHIDRSPEKTQQDEKVESHKDDDVEGRRRICRCGLLDSSALCSANFVRILLDACQGLGGACSAHSRGSTLRRHLLLTLEELLIAQAWHAAKPPMERSHSEAPHHTQPPLPTTSIPRPSVRPLTRRVTTNNDRRIPRPSSPGF